MTAESRHKARVACSVFVPFVVLAILLFILQGIGPGLPNWTGVVVLMLSAGAGFAFLKDELRNVSVLVAGLFYFPVMVAMLLYFSMVFSVQFLGEGP